MNFRYVRVQDGKTNMEQVYHECFIKTFKDAQNNFIKRIWNTFVRLDTLCYYKLCDVVTILCSLNVIAMVIDSFKFIFNSIMIDSFKLFSTPAIKDLNFQYDENKNIINNLYNFSRNTIKQVTTVEVPKSKNKISLILGFLFCIIPEFILRKILLGPLMFFALGCLLMTSWVGVFAFIPLLYFLWYVVKFVSKSVLVVLAIITTIILAVGVLLIACMYFILMTVFMFSLGAVMFLLYPILFGIRVVILIIITLIYYVLVGLSIIKKVCFLNEQSFKV
jgi:hypothetical protein